MQLTLLKNTQSHALWSVNYTRMWNKNDCQRSKTRPKHIKGSKERLFIRTQTHSLHISGEIPFVKLQNDT